MRALDVTGFRRFTEPEQKRIESWLEHRDVPLRYVVEIRQGDDGTLEIDRLRLNEMGRVHTDESGREPAKETVRVDGADFPWPVA